MSLNGALNIGKTSLAVQQAAIGVTGNNIANAGDAGYTRQVADLSPARDRRVASGAFVGQGVNLDAIRRQIDDALEARVRAGISDGEAAAINAQWLGQVESIFNELGDADLSTQLSTFFASWSNLANKPQDPALRQVVLTNGQNVAAFFQDLRGQLSGLEESIDARLPALVADADSLAEQVAALNGQIARAEGGGSGSANGLRDQRDGIVKKLAQLMDVKTVAQAPNGGVVNVYVGSEPLVLGTMSRGVAFRKDQPNGGISVVFKANGGTMKVGGGQLGGLQQSKGKVAGITGSIDGLANNLIFELNKLHASGQGLEGFATASATSVLEDPALALNDAKAGLTNAPINGSFVVHLKDKATGLTTSTLVQVDLDGIGGNDATLDSLRASIDAIGGVGATVNAGRLTVAAEGPGAEVSFSQDSSGTLAALGMNTFYAGTDARDIAVNQNLIDRPSVLAAARNGAPGDNQTARAIAALEGAPVAALNGTSLTDAYAATVTGLATSVNSAKSEVEVTRAVSETLQAQREALSGVSLDEEAMNLMRQQRAFQGAARLITTINEMMDTVLNMAR